MIVVPVQLALPPVADWVLSAPTVMAWAGVGENVRLVNARADAVVIEIAFFEHDAHLPPAPAPAIGAHSLTADIPEKWASCRIPDLRQISAD